MLFATKTAKTKNRMSLILKKSKKITLKKAFPYTRTRKCARICVQNVNKKKNFTPKSYDLRDLGNKTIDKTPFICYNKIHFSRPCIFFYNYSIPRRRVSGGKITNLYNIWKRQPRRRIRPQGKRPPRRTICYLKSKISTRSTTKKPTMR